MNCNTRVSCFLVLTLGALGGCSSAPATKESKKAAAALDRIQGKAQVQEEAGGAAEVALNAGGPSVYLLEGTHRYRLFLRTATQVVQGTEYVAEGVFAQKAIEDIGDPDQGKNGYPLQASCERVVKMAWTGLAFDAIDADASLLRAKVKRYPARPVFLVTRIRPATAEETSAASPEPKTDAAADAKIPEVEVAAEKQCGLLVEGPTVLPAPLWEPAGGTVRCKVVIDQAGKIADLQSYAQLCESVPWSKFRYQPPVQNGHPVKVRTEVEVRFEPHK